VGLVAITYVYFLIFAQFGFLKRLAELGISGARFKIVMAAMAAGGAATSLLLWRFDGRWTPSRRIQLALLGCSASALLSLARLNLAAGATVSLAIGASLGLLTVTLVTHLPLWIGAIRPLPKIGLAVGLGYFVCNCPALFEAPPSVVAIFAAGLCFAGIALAASRARARRDAGARPFRGNSPRFWQVLGCFTALVWFDSAVFYIIQHTASLKSGTWEGSRRLWQNGIAHFLAALAAGFALSRPRLSATLSLAFACLAGAAALFANPGTSALAAILYPCGVSLYSVALVAYPSFLARETPVVERARSAGRLYAVAGWLGSGLGIGMAEHLGRIPPSFIFLASLPWWAPGVWAWLQRRRREFVTTAALILAARVTQKSLSWASGPEINARPASLVEAGRRVYISEGCIHCHSQYARPNTRDEVLWGPGVDAAVRRAEQPPLIGNRRQGPDLARVGNRRSALWLKSHFMNPGMLSHDSPMPVYAHLFLDGRGAALVAYLQSLGGNDLAGRIAMTQRNGRLSDKSIKAAREFDGAALTRKHCATCHDAGGFARQTWKAEFGRPPPDLIAGPFVFAPTGLSPEWRLNRIAELIKFGAPGTDMPGHEYLPEAEIAAMALRLENIERAGTPTRAER
jgi:cytochrome c oxidase cbb3-type subunit 2